jgi:hypothetical protein
MESIFISRTNTSEPRRLPVQRPSARPVTGLALPALPLKSALQLLFMQDMLFLDTEFANHGLLIEKPRLSDVHFLSDLIKRSSLNAGAQHEHFPQNDSAWRSLIAAENIVIARTHDGRLAGFYATNQFALVHQPEELHRLRAAHNVLCNRFKLSDQKVSFGAQVLIDLPWQSSDLRPYLLRTLLRMVGLRYRFLFNVVKKDNLFEMRALPREGWRCFHEEDDTCYMMLDVAKALRLLASNLMLRIPNKSVAPVSRESRT